LLKNESQKKIKMLIAEDNEVSYLHLSIIIKDFAREILYAENGQLAVELVKNNPDVDLVLMDLKMPIMDGETALLEIRKFNKKVSIVAQTAYALEGDREKLIKFGFDDYISKPIDKQILMKIILKEIEKK
jgi:CheY-like chemotaxis protein